MARRTVLASKSRSPLFSLSQREADLLRHDTLSEEDLQNIGARRRPRNKLDFALHREPGVHIGPHNVARAERGVELGRVVEAAEVEDRNRVGLIERARALWGSRSANSPTGLWSGYGRRGNETVPTSSTIWALRSIAAMISIGVDDRCSG